MLSDVFRDTGMDGSIQRPVYDVVTGLPSGQTYFCKMGLARSEFVRPIEGSLNAQKFICLISKVLLDEAGWPHGNPQKGDIVSLDGQYAVVQHVLHRGHPEDLFFYCQTDG